MWDAFVSKQPYTIFVQSSRYGNFYESLGEKSLILGLYDDARLIGGGLVVSTHAKRGTFLYVPYGPLLPSDDNQRASAFAAFAEYLKKIAHTRGFDSVRVSPFLDDTAEHREMFKKADFRPAPLHVLAENTWLLDITPSLDAIIGGMNKNHRNLIRRCEREGVRIETHADPAVLSRLSALFDETEKRHKFHRFSDSYIEKEFTAFTDHGESLIYEAYLPNGTLDASAIIMFYGSMACYRHSASLNLDKRLPTSYLIQWRVIQDAKIRGMKWYNFWGVAPSGASRRHPFMGITHFKKGFGGMQKDLMHCQDMPLNSRYWFSWAIETARRLKRGF